MPPAKPEKKSKPTGPPRYTKSAAAAVAHVEYVLGHFTPTDGRRILAFVAAGLDVPKTLPLNQAVATVEGEVKP